MKIRLGSDPALIQGNLASFKATRSQSRFDLSQNKSFLRLERILGFNVSVAVCLALGDFHNARRDNLYKIRHGFRLDMPLL